MAGEIDYLGGVNVAGSLATMGEVILWGFVVGLLVGIVYLVYYLMSFLPCSRLLSSKTWTVCRNRY